MIATLLLGVCLTGEDPTGRRSPRISLQPRCARRKRTVDQMAFTVVFSAGHRCFAAGTPVRTLLGLRPIESIQVVDEVLAQDVTTGALSFAPVVALPSQPAEAHAAHRPGRRSDRRHADPPLLEGGPGLGDGPRAKARRHDPTPRWDGPSRLGLPGESPAGVQPRCGQLPELLRRSFGRPGARQQPRRSGPPSVRCREDAGGRRCRPPLMGRSGFRSQSRTGPDRSGGRVPPCERRRRNLQHKRVQALRRIRRVTKSPLIDPRTEVERGVWLAQGQFFEPRNARNDTEMDQRPLNVSCLSSISWLLRASLAMLTGNEDIEPRNTRNGEHAHQPIRTIHRFGIPLGEIAGVLRLVMPHRPLGRRCADRRGLAKGIADALERIAHSETRSLGLTTEIALSIQIVAIGKTTDRVGVSDPTARSRDRYGVPGTYGLPGTPLADGEAGMPKTGAVTLSSRRRGLTQHSTRSRPAR